MSQATTAPRAAGAEPVDYPMQRRCPFDPPEEYAGLRDRGEVIQVRVPTGQLAWLVTRYADVRRLLVDPRVSADRRHPSMPFTEDVTPQTRRNIAAVGRSLVGLDPPEHGVRRRMLITEFTVRRMQALRPHIQHTVDDCIDGMLEGPRPVDLVSALAVPVPVRTICELLGFPYSARDLIERTVTALLRRSVSAQERQQTSAELRAYIDSQITAKEAEPPDDLIGRLIVHDRESKLYDHDLLVGLTMLLMVAGFETTASMIALGVIILLQEPERLSGIVADPAVTNLAIEELLRYVSVVDALSRVAVEDIEVGDVTVRAGDGLLLSFLAANRDPTVFPEPSTMDIHRGARHHMAFGYGIHQCIGQNLAREELQIVYRTLFARVPGLRLAEPLDQLPFKADSNIFGVDHLQVTW
jgi:cytochrome P450